MRPIGKLPVTMTLGTQEYSDDFHIYPNVTATLLSWKAAKGLNILPDSYPYPPPAPSPSRVAAVDISHPTTAHNVITEFPSVFDGQIKTMEG